jgi:hypothetical protein
MPDLTQARLVDDNGTGLEVLRFDDSIGVITTSVSLGFPEIRSVSNARPAQDGTLDSTRFIGARTVTMELLMPSVAWYIVEDKLRAALHPMNRYYLYVLRDGWSAERRLLVRGAGYTEPGGVRSPTAQLQWVGVQGFMEEAPDQVGLVPILSGNEGGIATPVALPAAFAPGFTPGMSTVEVDGTIPTSPVATIYGPCTNPTLLLAGDTKQYLAFNLTIADGDFLFVDFSARTALLNNDPALSQYGSLDFSRSSWWQLPPGTSTVAFTPTQANGGSQAVLSWRPRYI